MYRRGNKSPNSSPNMLYYKIILVLCTLLFINGLKNAFQSEQRPSQELETLELFSVGVKCSRSPLWSRIPYHCENKPQLLIVLAALLMSGDIQPNPGPRNCSVFPCGHCGYNVSYPAVCCDECSVWFHLSCADKSTKDLTDLAQASWPCYRCNAINIDSFTFRSYTLELSNRYSVLQNSKPQTSQLDNSTFSPTPCFKPIHHSSPKHRRARLQEQNSTPIATTETAPNQSPNTVLSSIPGSSNQLPSLTSPTSITDSMHGSSNLNSMRIPSVSSPASTIPYIMQGSSMLTSPSVETHNSTDAPTDLNPQKPGSTWRTLILNGGGLKDKPDRLAAITECVKPDCILGCESWVDPSIKDSEVFPAGYSIHRRDRNLNGGGVFIAVRDCYTSSLIQEANTNCEIIWVAVTQTNSKPLYLGSYYRPPDEPLIKTEQLNASLDYILNQSSPTRHAILGGDFNVPGVDWNSSSVKPGADKASTCQSIIDITNDHGLTQQQLDATRGSNVLDLYFMTNPTLTKNVETIPGISDHAAIVVESDIKPMHNKPAPRKVYQYKKAEWEKIHEELTSLCDDFMETCANRDVSENWDKFKSIITNTIDKYVPCKLTSTRHNLPWLSQSIKRNMRKLGRMHRKAKNTGKVVDWAKFRRARKEVRVQQRKAHWNYVNTMLTSCLEDGNSKPFWKYIKAKKQDSIGVAPLKSDGKLHSSSEKKAEIMNAQFQSVFTREDTSALPELPESNHPNIGDLDITPAGIIKLLKNLQTNKASGPDGLPNLILKEYADILGIPLTAIFNQSLDTGMLPPDWLTRIYPPYSRRETDIKL